MRLSLDAIKLCERKFGKGDFVGFEHGETPDTSQLSEADGVRVFEELAQACFIEYETDMHINALGQHIFSMMYEPDQYFYLENKRNGRRLRIYLRNAYYLCILEENGIEETQTMYRFKLLPTLELVVSAFAYGLRESTEQKDGVEQSKPGDWKKEILLDGKAWNRGEQTEELHLADLEAYTDCTDLINAVTTWMFRNMADKQNVEEQRG